MPRQPHPLPTEARIVDLLTPFLQNLKRAAPPDRLFAQLSTYLDLLLRWNARINLTAIRDPEEIVRRHFGESLFTGTYLAGRLPPGATLLDFGSGAGFPGLPIQLLLPSLRVTLAESQGKKAAFLREAARTLSLQTEIWPHRVEEMPAERRFDAVTLRAVDRMPQATEAARARVKSGRWLVTLTAEPAAPLAGPSVPHVAGEQPRQAAHYLVPNSTARWLILEQTEEQAEIQAKQAI